VPWTHYAVVPSPDGNAVVTVDGALPCVESEGGMPQMLTAFEPLIGLPTYLRLAARARRGDDVLDLRVFDAGAGGDAVPLGDADPARLAPPELLPALERWLAEQQGAPVPELRPTWARPGWLAEAESWVGAPLELVGSWPLSAVLRSTQGDWFKAVFPLFHGEPAVTEALADAHPGLVPPVLRTDRRRGWMLMGEVRGADPIGLPRAAWAPVLRTLAEIHSAWSGRAEELLALGAQDRRVGSALPETLVHGDLNPGNFLLEDGHAVIFDWSDACVADPMFDVALLLFGIEDAAARAVLLDAYADARSLPRPELRATFAASEANAYLHQAESYRAICDALASDDRWWFEDEEELWRGWASDVLAGRRPSRGT
jgi:hypothetical protein